MRTREDALNHVGAMTDDEAAQGLIVMIGLLGLMGDKPEAIVKAIGKMVFDLREAERRKVGHSDKGAAIAAECLKETP